VRTAGSGTCGPMESPSSQYCSQARMFPARSQSAPTTVPQADSNMPVPGMAEIARARLNRTEVGVSLEPAASVYRNEIIIFACGNFPSHLQ
jgi:hypothetical protein